MTEKTPELDSSTPNASGLPHPDKITIAWLLHNVSLKMWLTALSLLGTFFVLELAFIQSPSVQLFLQIPRVQKILGFSVSNDGNEQEIKMLNQKIKEKDMEIERLEEKAKKNGHLPLEGIWEYSTHYTQYFGQPDSKTDPIRFTDGRAAFLWYGDKNFGRYHILAGGGVYNGKLKKLIATHVIELTLESDRAGYPIEGSSMSGREIARNTSNTTYDSHNDQVVDLRDLHVVRFDNNEIKSMTFNFRISDSNRITDGTVVFKRPPPQ